MSSPSHFASTPSTRRWLALASLVLLAALLNQALRTPEVGADDAFISYRYAANWNAGNGLVWNVGERVEGYSNFLFVLANALATRVFDAGVRLFALNAPPLSHYWVAVTLNAAALLAGQRLLVLRVCDLAPRFALPAAFAFAMTPAVWHWGAMGLETPVVATLQLAAVLLTTRLQTCQNVATAKHLRLLLCAAMATLVLTRADGFVTSVVVVAYLAVVQHRKAATWVFLSSALTWSAHAAGRLHYYGYLFPNTVYAKVSGPFGSRVFHGLRDFAEYAYSKLLFFGFLLIALWACRSVRVTDAASSPLRRVPLESVLAAVLALYFVFIGADVYEERFLLVVYPLSLIAAAALLASGAYSQRMTLGIALCSLTPILVPRLSDARYNDAHRRVDYRLELGAQLRPGGLCNPLGAADKDTRLAIDAAGKIPFFSRLPADDILGLNDTTLAHMPSSEFRVGHNKYNAEYTLSRRPRFISAWVHTPDLNFNWGLTEAKWKAAGYRPECLVRVPATDHVEIRNVADLAASEVSALVSQGFVYGVLMRDRPQLPAQ